MRYRVAALVALSVLAVAGCQDDPAPVDVLPTPPAEPRPPVGFTPPPRDWAPVPGLVRPDGAALDVLEVEVTEPLAAAAVEVVRTLDYRRDVDDTVTVHDLDDDGTAVVSLFHPDDVDGGTLELLAPARVALWSDAGMTELPSSESVVPGEPFREVAGAGAVDGSVVWLETSVYGLGESSWRVFRAGPDTGVALLARSEDVEAGDEEVVEPFPLSLTAAGDRAAWALEGLRPDGTVSAVVVSVPLAGDAPIRTESASATLPAATGTGIAVVRLDGGTGAPTGIEVLEQSGQVRPLVGFAEPEEDVPRFVRTLVADRDLLAWVLQGDLYVTGPDGAVAHRVRVGDDVVPESVAACDGRVVWARAAAEGHPEDALVLDQATGAVSVLELGPHTATITCGGPFLSWTEVRASDDGEVGTVVVARWAN